MKMQRELFTKNLQKTCKQLPLYLRNVFSTGVPKKRKKKKIFGIKLSAIVHTVVRKEDCHAVQKDKNVHQSCPFVCG